MSKAGKPRRKRRLRKFIFMLILLLLIAAAGWYAYNSLKAEYTVEGMHMYGDGYARILDALLPYLPEV